MLCLIFLFLRAAVLLLQLVIGRIPGLHHSLQPVCSSGASTNRGLKFQVLPVGFSQRAETPVFLCCR